MSEEKLSTDIQMQESAPKNIGGDVYQVENVDIYSYPKQKDTNNGVVMIGDLHGNAIKLLYFLIREGVLDYKDDVSDKDGEYKKLVELYKKAGELSEWYEDYDFNINKQSIPISPEEREKLEKELPAKQKDIQDIVTEFKKHLTQFKPTDKQITIEIIGDELSDRGSNDVLTLLEYELLGKNDNIHIHTTVSNHSNEFVRAFLSLVGEKKDLKVQSDISGNNDKMSFIGLKLARSAGAISDEELQLLVNKSYLPTIRAIDYTLDDNGDINIISHAPVEFTVIEALANNLGVEYDDSSSQNLADSIDRINTKFLERLANGTADELLNSHGVGDIEHMNSKEIIEKPFVHIMWNRWNEQKDTEEARPRRKNNYNIKYIHGHDPFESKFSKGESPNVINLDNALGKSRPHKPDPKVKFANEIINDPKNTEDEKKEAKQYINGLNQLSYVNSSSKPSKEINQKFGIIKDPESNRLGQALDNLFKTVSSGFDDFKNNIRISFTNVDLNNLSETLNKLSDKFFEDINGSFDLFIKEVKKISDKIDEKVQPNNIRQEAESITREFNKSVTSFKEDLLKVKSKNKENKEIPNYQDDSKNSF